MASHPVFNPPRKSRNGKRAVVLCILCDVNNIVLTLKMFTKSKGNDNKLLLGIGRLSCGAFNCYVFLLEEISIVCR